MHNLSMPQSPSVSSDHSLSNNPLVRVFRGCGNYFDQDICSFHLNAHHSYPHISGILSSRLMGQHLSIYLGNTQDSPRAHHCPPPSCIQTHGVLLRISELALGTFQHQIDIIAHQAGCPSLPMASKRMKRTNLDRMSRMTPSGTHCLQLRTRRL